MIKKFIIITFFSHSLIAQDSLVVIPGEHYKSGPVYEFFMGKHWRDIWTSEVKVKILDMNTYAGGLDPIKLGGGQQTRSLRFQGGDGPVL